MPKIIKIQILTLKFHFFTNFVNFYQKSIFFNYASPQKILDHKNFPKVKIRHAYDPKMPKFGHFFQKKNTFLKLYFQIISIYHIL